MKAEYHIVRYAMKTLTLLVRDDRLRLGHGVAQSLPEAYNAAIDGIAVGEGVGSC
jgi:hypothetical protein